MTPSSLAELSQWNRAISACARQTHWMLSLQLRIALVVGWWWITKSGLTESNTWAYYDSICHYLPLFCGETWECFFLSRCRGRQAMTLGPNTCCTVPPASATYWPNKAQIPTCIYIYIHAPRKSRCCCWMTRWCLAELSRQIFNKLQHTHVRSDVITLTSAINACDKGNSWQLAMHSFFWWRDLVVPNAITCTTLMSALNTKAEWQQCLCLIQFCLAAPWLSLCSWPLVVYHMVSLMLHGIQNCFNYINWWRSKQIEHIWKHYIIFTRRRFANMILHDIACVHNYVDIFCEGTNPQIRHVFRPMQSCSVQPLMLAQKEVNGRKLSEFWIRWNHGDSPLAKQRLFLWVFKMCWRIWRRAAFYYIVFEMFL